MVRVLTTAFLIAAIAAPLAARPARTPALASTQFNCDALSTSGKLDAATLRDLGPAHSLDAAAAVLAKHGVKYERTQGVMTLSGVPERMLRNINTLPQGEPIILPNGDATAICVLRPSADSI
jgi:hypothetical protein